MRKPNPEAMDAILAAQRSMEAIHESPVDERDRLTVAQRVIEGIAEKPPTPKDLEIALAKYQREYAAVMAQAQGGDPAAVARLDRMTQFFNAEIAPHLPQSRVLKGTPVGRNRLETNI